MSEWQIGKEHSHETLALIEERVYSKRRGRTYEEIYGPEEAARIREAKRTAMQGKNTGCSPERLTALHRGLAKRKEKYGY